MALPKPPASLAKAVLKEMEGGKSLRQAAISAGTTAFTFLRMCEASPELAQQYAHTREEMIDRMFDDLMAVADEPPAMTPNGQVDSAAVQKQRLQVDTRKWALSKLAPRKYGEKLTLAGDEDNPIKSSITVSFVKPSDVDGA